MFPFLSFPVANSSSQGAETQPVVPGQPHHVLSSVTCQTPLSRAFTPMPSMLPASPPLTMMSSSSSSYTPPPVPVIAQRHMFTPESRRALLREVIRLKPYADPSMWDSVTHQYSWWCYRNILPTRRNVPKDRLRKKVKSIIAQYPTAVPTASPPSESSLLGDMKSSTPALEEDNLPYDPETLALIEEVVKQYTESVQRAQTNRLKKRSFKRDSTDYSLVVLPQSQSAIGPAPPSPSQGSTDPLLHNTSISNAMEVGDMIESRYKRPRLDTLDAQQQQQYESNAAAVFNTFTHAARDPLISTPSDTSDDGDKDKDRRDQQTGSKSVSSTTSSLNDMLANAASRSELAALDQPTTVPLSTDPSTSTASAAAGPSPAPSSIVTTVAAATSSAVLRQIPSVLQAMREKTAATGSVEAPEEASATTTQQQQHEIMSKLGSSMGVAIAESMADSFAATVSSAIEQLLRRMEQKLSDKPVA